MNLLTRALRYTRAYCGLSALNERTTRLADHPGPLVREVFAFCEGFLEPNQVEREIAQLASDVRQLRPRNVLEIGTSMGGTLYLWTRLAEPDATIVSVDLPGGRFGGGYSGLRTGLYRRFSRGRQTLHLLRADSHAPETARRVQDLFQGQGIDFLFIDGDHTYQGVREDWETYGPLVRPGGMVAFHDVAMNYENTEVKRLWDEIKMHFPHREYLEHQKGFYGIGLLYK